MTRNLTLRIERVADLTADEMRGVAAGTDVTRGCPGGLTGGCPGRLTDGPTLCDWATCH